MKRYTIMGKTLGGDTYTVAQYDTALEASAEMARIQSCCQECREYHYLLVTPEDSAEPTDSKIATSAAKVPYEMVPMAALAGVSRVMAYGKKKHGHGNFHTATFDDGAPGRYFGGVLRHYTACQERDSRFTRESLATLDEESGLPELDHIICGLLMLRAILTKDGVLPADPGVGNEPPSKEKA